MSDVSRESRWKWDRKKVDAAILLAQGYLIKETAKTVGVSIKSITRWKQDDIFGAEVDRLSLMMGIASRAERLRIAQRVVREKMKDEKIETDKDLLDWLKFSQSETDGIKLDLTTLLDHATPVAGSGSDGVHPKAKDGKSEAAKPAARSAETSKAA